MATDSPLPTLAPEFAGSAGPYRGRVRWTTVLNYVLLLLGGVVMVFPFIWMVLSAFKRSDEIIAYPPIFFPSQPNFDLLVRVWTEINFGRYFANSLLTATVATVAVLLTSALVGFVLAKYRFRGQNLLFVMVLATMMIPWPVLLIPQYLIAVELKLLNTYWALILPSLYSSFGIFMMRQFMHSIPNELLDAARIDGASEPHIFARLVLPLATPVLAALAIFHFMWHWDSLIWPLVVINTRNMYTLPLGLATFTNQYWTDYAAVNAGATVSVIPVLIVYVVLQRQFIEGIAMTGMKA
ncbi:MAG: L-arabinose transport system permease protein AraQ [Chloroflexi bacterium ADurb.Bin325]|nr:MAG: L-arabinose transport system permease protein AraQ [Chloroflexi bacterium ADurb.Bin325]